MGEEIIIVPFIFGVFAYIIVQFLNHRQRMRMIDKGITKIEFSQGKPRTDNPLKYGIIAIALGLAIFIAQLFQDVFRFSVRGEIGLALVPLFVGIALVIFAFIDRKSEKEGDGSDFLEMKRDSEGT